MYLTLADVMIEAAKDEHTRVVLWHGDDAKEAFNAFLEERPPDFTRTMKSASAAYAGAVA
jgi:1,4-dihydroxy-2-naphthoyl-CoA synthase